MSRIVYEKEEVLEEVFSGTFILDGLRMSEEEQLQRIIDMMAEEGINVDNPEDLVVTYEGVEDDNGISDTQSTKFTVRRKVEKEVPYKIEEEYVYGGEFTESESMLSKEEQEKIVFKDMAKEGIYNENDSYSVVNNGVDGEYDTPIETYSVYKVISKTPLEEDKEFNLEEVVVENKTNDNEINKEDIEKVKEELEELKQLRDKLNSITDVLAQKEIISQIIEKTDNVEKEAIDSTEVEVNDDFRKELSDLEEIISKVQNEIKEYVKKYDDIYGRLQEIIDQENEKFSNKLLSEEEIDELKEEFDNRKLEENEKSIELKQEIDLQRRLLSSLKRRRNRLEREMEKAEALGLTYSEYKDISSTLQKTSIMNKVLARKGLEDIINKKASDRTKEEQDILKDAKEEILNEIADIKREDKDISVMDAIESLYLLDEEYKLEENPKGLSVSEDDIVNIKERGELLPARVIGDYPKEYTYEPGKAPIDLVDQLDNMNELVGESEFDSSTMTKEDEFRRIMGFDYDPAEYDIRVDEGVNGIDDGVYEQLKIYKKNKENNINSEKPIEYDYNLVGESEFDSSTMTKEDEFRRIMGFDYDPDRYEIRIDEGVNGIDDGVNEVLQIFEKVPREELEEDPIINDDEIDDTLPIDINEDDNEDENLDNIEDDNEDENLDNLEDDNEDENINDVEDEDENVDDIEDDNEDEFDNRSEVVERITLFRDLDNDGDIYIRKPLLSRFEIEAIGDPVRIDGALCYRIDEEDVDYIIDMADNDVSPYIIDVVDVNLGKRDLPDDVIENEDDIPDKTKDEDDTPDKTKDDGIQKPDDDTHDETKDDGIQKPDNTPDKTKVPEETTHVRPHVEQILAKLTKGLDIGKKDASRYKASNIKVSKSFKEELHSGNWLYNVAHFGIAVIKFPFNLIRKVSSKLLLGARGKKAMEELKSRLDNLSEEELQVLFEEYKGTRLKTDMNNQINPIILDKLKEYGLSKVEKLNDKIKKNYTLLFALLGQIKALEEKIATSEDKEELEALYEERKKLMSGAAEAIRSIENDRVEADNLLSSGVHGIEEDFKAVSTKLSYVGMRFAKSQKFDNELQAKLGEYGQGLNEALANDDDENIVSNFMGLESCYYNNTKIAGSLAGKRSVGSKYYSPIAEQFDYRDDPFIRDLLTTIALTSATVNAVNAIRVHQIEDARLLQQQQMEANRVNGENDAVMDQVHQVGNNITGQAGKFQRGMEAQANQDGLNVANMAERGDLDHHNWIFGEHYRAEDRLNHEMYNNVYDDATSRITDITSRYSNGTIDQVGVLQEMSDVVNTTQASLHDVVDSYLQICKEYAENHPQFDLHAVQSAMNYIENNPQAIAEMHEGMVYSVEQASTLAGLTAEHVTALSSLPSDMYTSLVGAAGAAALALKVVNDMKNKYGKKGTYGNEVVDMMEEYLSQKDDEIEDEEVRTK